MISVIHMIIRCFLDQNRCDNLDFCFDLTLSRIKISTCITMYTIQSQKLMIKEVFTFLLSLLYNNSWMNMCKINHIGKFVVRVISQV